MYLWISYVGGGGKASLNISDLKCHDVGVGSKCSGAGTRREL